jgi:hypothetical protein
LIHWKPGEGEERARRLREAGYEVEVGPILGPGFLRDLRERPPLAVVIDLTRLPMQGRDVGLSIRHQVATRGLPLVFAEGEREKVARVKQSLPDAVYTTWGRIGPALARALARPPARPVVPSSVLAGYSGTPLPKKLGIREASAVALVGAPRGFARTLGRLPPGARLRSGLRGSPSLILWFVRSKRELAKGFAAIRKALGEGAVWICWPKLASGEATDLTQAKVRETGLASGLVDYKICAIDAVWSGLLFTRRRA